MWPLFIIIIIINVKIIVTLSQKNAARALYKTLFCFSVVTSVAWFSDRGILTVGRIRPKWSKSQFPHPQLAKLHMARYKLYLMDWLIEFV